MLNHIGTFDLGVIIAYLVVIVGVGCYAGLKKRKESGANRYFLASHALRWPSIGLALFATNISCLHLVSLAQAGYDQGLLMGNFEWMAGFTLILLSLFFVPFYIRAKVATLPDFLEKRYCRECRDRACSSSRCRALRMACAAWRPATWSAPPSRPSPTSITRPGCRPSIGIPIPAITR